MIAIGSEDLAAVIAVIDHDQAPVLDLRDSGGPMELPGTETLSRGSVGFDVAPGELEATLSIEALHSVRAAVGDEDAAVAAEAGSEGLEELSVCSPRASPLTQEPAVFVEELEVPGLTENYMLHFQRP